MQCVSSPSWTMLVSSQTLMDAVQWSLMANLHPSSVHVQIFKWDGDKNDYLSFPLTCAEMSWLSVSLQLIHCFRAPLRASDAAHPTRPRHC